MYKFHPNKGIKNNFVCFKSLEMKRTMGPFMILESLAGSNLYESGTSGNSPADPMGLGRMGVTMWTEVE